jgi:hypothetical protein
MARYEGAGVRLYFRADAAFASPEIYDYLEEHGLLYAIRLPSNPVLEQEIEPLLKRPVGRPPQKPIVWYDDFWYQAASWDRPRRVVAKVEWHQGELFPRVGFLVTNLWAKPEGVVHFYQGRQSGPTHSLPIWGVMPTREWLAGSSHGNCHAGLST